MFPLAPKVKSCTIEYMQADRVETDRVVIMEMGPGMKPGQRHVHVWPQWKAPAESVQVCLEVPGPCEYVNDAKGGRVCIWCNELQEQMNTDERTEWRQTENN